MEEKVYRKIQEYLEDNEIYLSDAEVDTVIRLSKKAQVDSEHTGFRVDRIEHNDREKSFHDHWKKENLIQPGLNFGNGTLQGLFCSIPKGTYSPAFHHGIEVEITKRDRMIVATVIQWLGSNCGWCFLEETLKDCGYKIVKLNP